MDKPLVVLAGIISKGDEILIAQRLPTSAVEPNKWEFPGGKLEPPEALEDCLAREIKEELGLTIEVQSLYDANAHVYDLPDKKLSIVLIFYEARWLSGEITLKGCQNAVWLPKKRLTEYDFAAADVSVMRRLHEGS